MIGAVRLRDDQLAPDQLERLALEHAKIYEPVVLDSLPAPERERGLHHPLTLAAPDGAINVESWIRRRTRYHPRGAPGRAGAPAMTADAERSWPWRPCYDGFRWSSCASS